MQVITLALGFLSVVSAGAVEKRQAGPLGVTFPAFLGSNTTSGAAITGSITFAASSGGVAVSVNLASAASRKRQVGATAGVTYTIHTGPASAGCAAVGPIAPGGDLSAQGGLAIVPSSFTFITTTITLASISGLSVVIASADGLTIYGCGTIAPISTAPTTSVTVNVNVNVAVNVAVTIANGCLYCPAITTAYWSAYYVPYACTTLFYGISYVCAAAGWINVYVPCTIAPGVTTIVYVAPKTTVSAKTTVVTYTSSCACATPSTTVVTVPASVASVTTKTITTVPATVPPTTVAAVSTAVATKAVVSQIAIGGAAQNKAVGALAALAAVAAFF